MDTTVCCKQHETLFLCIFAYYHILLPCIAMHNISMDLNSSQPCWTLTKVYVVKIYQYVAFQVLLNFSGGESDVLKVMMLINVSVPGMCAITEKV